MFIRSLGPILLLVCTAVWSAGASDDLLRRAEALYQQTEYTNSLQLLETSASPDARVYLLSGKDYFMLADYRRATEFFEKAMALSANDSTCELWLGRAWGRRAETSGWLTAGVHASRARQSFERAVALDPNNREAKNDLFDFYLNAPGFLGGGLDKAEAIARGIAKERPPESEFELAQVSDRRKDYASAEIHLRRAMELAPSEVGRILDLARYIAKRGRFQESDQLFEKARNLAPSQPKVAFAEARVNIENHRKLDQARGLLQQYLRASLTPDDPPRQEAEKLLRRAGG